MGNGTTIVFVVVIVILGHSLLQPHCRMGPVHNVTKVPHASTLITTSEQIRDMMIHLLVIVILSVIVIDDCGCCCCCHWLIHHSNGGASARGSGSGDPLMTVHWSIMGLK